MGYKHETTRRYESETFEGVTVFIYKMTEGRRADLRSRIAEYNAQMRDILREQDVLNKVPEEERDIPKLLELNDKFDGLQMKISPEWILWGVKSIEGLEADGRPLTVSEWTDWPSALFDEVLTKVREETELKGAQIKNSQLRTGFGEAGQAPPKSLTAESVERKDSGETATAPFILKTVQ
jgi:hypothetical protein